MKPEKPLSIFINYRRDDCLDEARQICDLLQQAFGEEAVVFLDEKSITLTAKWKKEIQQSLSKAEVMLSLIGPRWEHSFKDPAPSAPVHQINDWVRFEIETALDERIDVVPVFLYTNTPNDGKHLPEKVASIIERQGFDIKRGELVPKIAILIRSLRLLMGYPLEDHEKINPPVPLPPLASLPLNQDIYLGKLYAVDENGEKKIKMPFLGPVYYSDNEAALYFGRDQEIRQLFHLARRNRLVLFNGYSGSGKSSLLHAGLLPRMKDIPSWQVLPPLRRNKAEGGLARQLKLLWDRSATEKRTLIILDQVEEMYTDPLNVDEPAVEIEALRKLLGSMIKQFPRLHFILAFRSEFFAKLSNEFLSKYDLHRSWNKLYLRSLNAEGIKKAVKAPMQERLQKLFNYRIKQGLVEKLASDFSDDDYSPHTVLLQIQLVELWKAAQDKAKREDKDTNFYFW